MIILQIKRIISEGILDHNYQTLCFNYITFLLFRDYYCQWSSYSWNYGLGQSLILRKSRSTVSEKGT